MQTVLILTMSADEWTIDTIREAIANRGGRAIFLLVDKYPVDYTLTYLDTQHGREIWLDTPTGREAIHACTSIWYRRMHSVGHCLKERLQAQYVTPAIRQAICTLEGLLEGFGGFVLCRPSSAHRLNSREEQMLVARHAGLAVPNTCLTNSPDMARHFIAQHQKTIVKSPSSWAVTDNGQTMVMYTNLITIDDVANLDSLQYTPLMFQEAIPKKVELRITVVGHSIFAYSLDSQQFELSTIDWRRGQGESVNHWQPYTLPPDVSTGIHQFMASYGLNYGAFDFIVDHDNTHYFIEINAAGQYQWLDVNHGLVATDHLAALLLGQASRREHGLDAPRIPQPALIHA